MKTFKFLSLGALLFMSAGVHAATLNSVEAKLPNIQDRVRQCTSVEWVKDRHENVRFSDLKSHCPEVKVISANGNTKVKVKVAGHQFVATLLETDFTDGDFYDVLIADLSTGDQYRMDNVLAYGDVLLGVLEGNLTGVKKVIF